MLSPYQNRWVKSILRYIFRYKRYYKKIFYRWIIKARVTHKSTIRTWSNSRGEGKLFSMDLIDESGEIRCVAFNKQCDTFYDLIDVCIINELILVLFKSMTYIFFL